MTQITKASQLIARAEDITALTRHGDVASLIFRNGQIVVFDWPMKDDGRDFYKMRAELTKAVGFMTFLLPPVEASDEARSAAAWQAEATGFRRDQAAARAGGDCP